MRVTLLALGSRGDVQPFVALAVALQEVGHAVTLAAALDYQPLVQAYHIPFAPLVGSIRQLVDREQMGVTVHGGTSRTIWRFFRDVPPILERLLRDANRAAYGTDMLIVSSLGLLCLPYLDVAYGTPLMVAHFHPNSPTANHPQAFFPSLAHWMPGRGSYHRATYVLYKYSQALLLHTAFNRARYCNGLPSLPVRAVWQKMKTRPPASLNAYSPYVAPPVSDADSDDQGTGFWFLPPPRNWSPSPALQAFLGAGSPPVYIGFGSIMHGEDAGRRLTTTIVEALRLSGLRGIVGQGWGDVGTGELPDFCLAVDDVPHAWLFQRVAGVVHHGGAGVAAASLQAGRPSLTIPFFGDQNFWAQRLVALGAALPPLRPRELDVPTLAAALRQLVNNPSLTASAQKGAKVLAQENGLAMALALIERRAKGQQEKLLAS